MNRPANPFVANFVGMESLIPGTVLTSKNGTVTVSIPGYVIEAVGEQKPEVEVFCGIRPENVVIDSYDPAKPNHNGNIFPAKVVGITSLGPFLKVTLDCGFPLVSYVTRGSFARLKLAIGEEVLASFNATAVHLISRKI
jgi:tungstate transport system ATP-binding protein